MKNVEKNRYKAILDLLLDKRTSLLSHSQFSALVCLVVRYSVFSIWSVDRLVGRSFVPIDAVLLVFDREMPQRDLIVVDVIL